MTNKNEYNEDRKLDLDKVYFYKNREVRYLREATMSDPGYKNVPGRQIMVEYTGQGQDGLKGDKVVIVVRELTDRKVIKVEDNVEAEKAKREKVDYVHVQPGSDVPVSTEHNKTLKNN